MKTLKERLGPTITPFNPEPQSSERPKIKSLLASDAENPKQPSEMGKAGKGQETKVASVQALPLLLGAIGAGGGGLLGQREINEYMKNKQNRTVPMENPPKEREVIRKEAFSDGILTGADGKGVNIDTHRSEKYLEADWEDLVRKSGGDPDGSDFYSVNKGEGVGIKLPSGAHAIWRRNSDHGPTLEIQIP